MCNLFVVDKDGTYARFNSVGSQVCYSYERESAMDRENRENKFESRIDRVRWDCISKIPFHALPLQ